MDASWMPLFFLCMIGFAIVVYAVLDGYDLGVGILIPLDQQSQNQRDIMIASIGPFWDANETWLVLAVGLMLIAFPMAHNVILSELYTPAVIMLAGLVLRGAAFDFRVKAIQNRRVIWEWVFKMGSLITGLSQGYMLGRYVVGFVPGIKMEVFAWVSAVCVTAAYAFIGGAWLIMKTEGALQGKMIAITRRAAWFCALGILAVSVVNLWVNPGIGARWFAFPQVILLAPIPLLCFGLFILNDCILKNMERSKNFGIWIPFLCASMIFFLCFQGLAYSFYPYVVPGQLTVWQAASAPESLLFLFYGVVFVMPCIVFYTAYSYRVFWGKATALKYH